MLSKHGCAASLSKGVLELARPERPVSIRHPVRLAAMHSVAHAAARLPSAPRPPATSSAPAQSRAPACQPYSCGNYAQVCCVIVKAQVTHGPFAVLPLCMHRHCISSTTQRLKCAEAACIKPILGDVRSTWPRVHRPPHWEQQGNHEQVGISSGTMLAVDSGRCSSGGRQGCLWALPSTDRCIRLGSCAAQQRMHSLACARRPAKLCRALGQKRIGVQLHCHAGTCSPAPVS